jgi:hypothetical protein
MDKVTVTLIFFLAELLWRNFFGGTSLAELLWRNLSGENLLAFF